VTQLMFDETEKMFLVHTSLKVGLEGSAALYLNVYGVNKMK
jgi:hypothetical protein